MIVGIRGYTIEETSPGIYTVKGDIIPIQVIDSRKLSASENLWLEGIRKRLGPLEVLQISDESAKQDMTLFRPYFHVIAQANPLALEEAAKMSKDTTTLDEVLERIGFNARVEERKALKIAQNLVNLGLPMETVVSATQLELEKVKELYTNKPC